MRVGEPARVHCKECPKSAQRAPKDSKKGAQEKAHKKGTRKPTHSEQSDSNPYVCVLAHAIIGLLDELVHHPVAL